MEFLNTADGPVDVSAALLCANFSYVQVQNLTVEAFDDTGNNDLTLAEGEYLAVQWNQVDADAGDMALYLSGTGNFGDPDNIIDYLRWGADGGEADRQNVAVDAGIWTSGDFTDPAQTNATIAFLGSNPTANNNPDDWNEGTPTPAASNVVLPVELTAFDGVADVPGVLLTWRTASETNNAGFEVQYRQDGSFEPVGFVDGAGTTTQPQHYQYRVDDLSPGRHAFRLRQIDTDGSAELSATVTVALRLPQAYALSALHPNPTSGTSRFTLAVRTEQTVRVHLYDALGRRVRTIYEGALSTGQVRDFSVAGEQLARGIYFVRVRGANFRETRKLVIAE